MVEKVYVVNDVWTNTGRYLENPGCATTDALNNYTEDEEATKTSMETTNLYTVKYEGSNDSAGDCDRNGCSHNNGMYPISPFILFKSLTPESNNS
jgi:hypothetical protein